MTRVILSVPHAFNGNDAGAIDIAGEIRERLVREGFKANLFANYQKREEVDGNRHHSRRTGFRRDLATAVKALRGRGLLLDVHTFPPDKGFWPEDVVLLHSPGVQDHKFLRQYARDISGAPNRMLTAAVRSARYEDDIVIHARQLGHPADSLVLAEHRRGSDVEIAAAAHVHAVRAWAQRKGFGK